MLSAWWMDKWQNTWLEKIQRCSKHITPLALTHQAVIFQYGIATPMVREAKYVHVKTIPTGSS